LAKYSGEEFDADVTSVGIRQTERDIALNHELVFSAGVWAVKAQLLEV